MSWDRQDDPYWNHPKTLALIAQGTEGMTAIAAFWLLNSYCNKMVRGSFSVWEAAMVLRRSNDEAEQILASLLVVPSGFEHGFLLQSKAEAEAKHYSINSFDDYRSKDEARAKAGAQGGVKSGKSRRSKTEPLIPYPESHNPLPESLSGDDGPNRSNTGKQLQDLEQKGFGSFGALKGPFVPMIQTLLPITDQGFSDASRGDAQSWQTETPLRRYLAQTGETQRAFALRLAQVRGVAVNLPVLSCWVSGARRPGALARAQIEQATHGAVRAIHWEASTALPAEAQLLAAWFESRKKERDRFTLDDAAEELTHLRGWRVYAPQLWSWIHNGRMSPSTRKFVRENQSKLAS